MPTEFRKLTFSLTELATIIEGYDQIADHFLESQKVVSVEINLGVQSALIVHCYNSEDECNTSFRLNAEYVGAALIWCCLKSQIPIPRNATRSLMISEDGMALVLQIQTPLQTQGTPLPDFFDYDFFG